MNTTPIPGVSDSALAAWISARLPAWPPASTPEFSFPAPLARLFARLPQRPPTIALVAVLNLALGRLLPRESLEPVLGKTILIRVLDAGLELTFSLGPSGFRPAARGAPSDLRISASTRDFIALALRHEDPDALFFDRRLLLEGDTDLGLVVKNTLDAVDVAAFLERFRPLR
ncbi:MAG: SCP2 sterol-binding domain-containing protein [Burkholderiaceae bacterium]|nr:SCP2 sterol-binding domain-containing protein [Burkholderiaceae bacterium]